MKIFIQTDTPSAGESRPRQLVLETAAAPERVKDALREIGGRLGVITAVPPAPHEHNLKQLLPRDLAALGILQGSGGEGEAVLHIVRTPGQTGAAGQADVIGLAYEVK